MEKQFTIHYWGPLLFKIKVDIKDVKTIRKLCDSGTEKYNTGLAGLIDDEILIDKAKYVDILAPYLSAYKEAHRIWYSRILKKITMNSAWVNYMKKGESNPPHIHHNCQLSSVLLLDVPKKITQEQKNWKGTGSGPGVLSFFVGNPQSFHNNFYEFKGEVGDFFIFPWNLTHNVATYKSNVTRVSVAANFNLEYEED
tara:strand:- start:1508 stop:2098 length:591 start_codon:yes stop_codon:yes gene_type:complete